MVRCNALFVCAKIAVLRVASAYANSSDWLKRDVTPIGYSTRITANEGWLEAHSWGGTVQALIS